jgi:tetratricopeptide (TPR) repeat protein
MLVTCALVAAGALLACGCAGPGPPQQAPCVEVDADLRPLFDARWSDVTAADGWVEAWRAAQRAVERLLVSHDEWIALGWCDFRSGRLDRAAQAFVVAQSRVRHSADAAIGLGYVALRQDRVSDATRLFTLALENSPSSADAREGIRLALQRLEMGDAAAAPAARVLRKIAGRSTADAQDAYLLAMAEKRARGSAAP